MKFVKWLDERTGLGSAFTKIANWQSPAGKFCCRFLPIALIFLFLLQALTGVFLWAFYSSSATSAWESVFYIQYVLPCGWLLRGIHHYSAQLFVGVSGFYVLALILHGAYRRPREFVYWSALVIFLLSLCSCLTGDLLTWSQSGYFATLTRVSFLQLLPVIGVPLYQIVVGGPDPQFGTLTITRFLFLHVCVFGGGGFLTICLWKFFDIRSRKLLRTEQRFDGIHKCCLACGTKKRCSFWRNEAFMAGLTCLVTFAVVLLLVFQHSLTDKQIANRSATLPAEAYLGAQLTGPVDVSSSYDAARPEWSFRALYHLSKLPIFSKIGMIYAIFVIPPLLLLFFLAAPILGRNKTLHHVVVAATCLFFVVACYFTYRSYWSDYSTASEESAAFKASVADAHRTADRAIELAFAPAGIPKTGALTLIQNDPYSVGPVLYDRHCVSCHNFQAKGNIPVDPDYPEMECSEPTAPNLYGSQQAEWIRGFLNEETLIDDDRFGQTEFAEVGSMIIFLRGRVTGGLELEDGSFILNGSGLIAKVIAADSSPAFDILEAVFEDLYEDDDAMALLDDMVNEDDELDDDEVEEAQKQYIATLRELIEGKFDDSDFISSLDPQLPAPVLSMLRRVLLEMLEDETYLDLLLDEYNIELVQDEYYDEFLEEEYLATLNGNDEPIPSDELKYIDMLRESIVEACYSIADLLAEEAKLDEPRPFVGGEYYGLEPTMIPDMDFLTCTECHSFYGIENDLACDLRGYMSRDWIAGFIADPTLTKYYGEMNDRMQAYLPEEGDALMTQEEVYLLADWLSGKWYRAPEVENATRTGTRDAAKQASMEHEVERLAREAEEKAHADALKAQALQEEREREAALEEELQAKEEKAKAAAVAKEKKEAEEKTKLQEEIKELRDALDKAIEANEEADEALTSLEQERNAAQTAAVTLLKRLEAAQAQAESAAAEAATEKSDAEQRVANAQSELQQRIQEQEALAQSQVDSLKAQYQQALDSQRELMTQQLSESQSALEVESQARQTAESRASELNAALLDAQQSVEALREQLEQLQNANALSDEQ
ncbi:MAG: cytochrome b N-terminal domain-containing protein [Thermoguttaceae bacterium]|jgi:ubiquinol-cytochrome c reductase cytochrome b subunit